MDDVELNEKTAKLMTMLEDRYNTQCSDGKRIVDKIPREIADSLGAWIREVNEKQIDYSVAIQNFAKYLSTYELVDPLNLLSHKLYADFRAYFGAQGSDFDGDNLWNAFSLIGLGFKNPRNESRIHEVTVLGPRANNQLIGQYRYWYAVKRAMVALDSEKKGAAWSVVQPMIGAALEIAISDKAPTTVGRIVASWKGLCSLEESDKKLFSIRG